MTEDNLKERWDSGEGLLFRNPADVRSGPSGLPVLEEGEVGFATSGTTGEPKVVVHTRNSLEASARMVLAHLGVEREERWLRALPAFHVGGFGVELRAWLLGSQAAALEGKWSASAFREIVDQRRIHWSSLVPAQVADLVELGVAAPDCLRGIVVGGGFLAPALAARARVLGWPVVASFGMSEAGSQVATGLPDAPVGRDLSCLAGWELKTDSGNGVLELKGAALASGYFVMNKEPRSGAEAWQRVPLPGEDGWFRSSDVVALGAEGTRLRWTGRIDSAVKILGELVSLDALQRELDEAMLEGSHAGSVVVVDVAGSRERELVFVAEEGQETRGLEDLTAQWNTGRPGFMRVAGILRVKTLPRSPVGKVLLRKLREELTR